VGSGVLVREEVDGLHLACRQIHLHLGRDISAAFRDGGRGELDRIRRGKIFEALPEGLLQALLQVGQILALQALGQSGYPGEGKGRRRRARRL